MWTVGLVKQRLHEAFAARRNPPDNPASLRARETIAWLGMLDKREARMVSLWAFAAAERVPLRKILRSRGVSPTQFYRLVNAALDRIVLELAVSQSVEPQAGAGTTI
jgi:hypothetical protein